MEVSLTKHMIEGYRIYSAPYCSMQHLLKFEEKVGYNAGVYGWNWDCYHVRGTDVLIVTGYRNLCGRPLRGIREYEKAAEDFISACSPLIAEREVKALLRALLLDQPD